MADGTGYTAPHLFPALARIHREKLSGNLILPQAGDPALLIFSEGFLVALDTQTGQQRLIPFLKEKGYHLQDLLSAATSTLSLAHLQSIQPVFLEFLGQLLDGPAYPGKQPEIQFQLRPGWESPSELFRIGLPELLVNYFDRWLSPRTVRALLPDLDQVYRLAGDYLQRSRTMPLTPRQGFVLSRLHDGQTLRELTNLGGISEEQVLRAILTFWFFELLQVAVAIPGQGGPSPAATPPTRPGAPAPRPAPAPPAGPRPAASAPPATSKPPAQPAEGAGGPVQVPAQLLSEIEDLAIQVQQANFYQILDVDYHAETSEIRHRFMELTKQYHPDKFQQYNNPELSAKADTIFAKITEAYEILKEPTLRSAYNERTGLDKAPLLPRGTSAPPPAPSGGGGKPEPGGPPAAGAGPSEPKKPHQKVHAFEDNQTKAQQHFVHGKEFFKNSKFFDAMEHFREAVRLMPEVAEYHYFLGRTLSMNPQRIREAEERLLKAGEMKPDRVEFHLELARFYLRGNLGLRSQKSYQKVFEMDPKNAEARQALGIKEKKPMNFKDFLKLDLGEMLKSKKEK